MTAAEQLTCPWCGAQEPNETLLCQNHWVRPHDATGYDWCTANKKCIGQELVLNHLVYALRNFDDADRIREYLDTAEAKWSQAKPEHRKHADTLFNETHARLEILTRTSAPPQHHAPAESEAVSLW